MNVRVNGDTVEIEGYVNSVERLSKLLHDRIGDFMERVKVGAFSRALERADDVRILLNHDYNRDLGGIKDGNLELYEDSIGLHARAIITDREVAEDARRGNLRGWSFGFTDRDVEQSQENGVTVRNVKDLNLYEVSLINRSKVPAYDGTLVAVRAQDGNALYVGEVVEAEIKLRDETPQKEEINADEKGAIDYTKYHEIIKEMKGE